MSRVADTASALVVGVSYGTPPHPPGLLPPGSPGPIPQGGGGMYPPLTKQAAYAAAAQAAQGNNSPYGPPNSPVRCQTAGPVSAAGRTSPVPQDPMEPPKTASRYEMGAHYPGGYADATASFGAMAATASFSSAIAMQQGPSEWWPQTAQQGYGEQRPPRTGRRSTSPRHLTPLLTPSSSHGALASIPPGVLRVPQPGGKGSNISERLVIGGGGGGGGATPIRTSMSSSMLPPATRTLEQILDRVETVEPPPAISPYVGAQRATKMTPGAKGGMADSPLSQTAPTRCVGWDAADVE